MKKLPIFLVIMTGMMFANQQTLTLPQKINDQTIKTKLDELGFCASKPNILKIKYYTSQDTSIRELEDIILEYL
jgi:hypothetical protein